MEILENILSFLDLRTLFGVQRVCHQWKNVIATSLPIQEKMFLRLRNDLSETWMMIDSNSVPCDLFSIPDSGVKFRRVSTAEAESGVWQDHRVEHLFKPVALNPMLYREDSLISDLEQGVGHAFSVTVPEKYSPHASYRDTYLTDPPCRDCRMDLSYEKSRSAPGGYHYRGSWATVRSNKPLTLGDLIDGALDSRDMYMGDHRNTQQCDGTISDRDFFSAKQTSEVGKNHHYRLVFQNERVGIGLALDEFKFRPLLLMDDEYLELRPTQDSSQ